MATHIYVKSGYGTKTSGGGDGSPRTGAFSSMAVGDVFGSLYDVRYGGLVAGDIVYVSDVHNSSSTQEIAVGLGITIPVLVISVDDTDCTVMKKGAKETVSSGANDLYLHGNCNVYGMEFELSDSASNAGTSGIEANFFDCTFTMNQTASFMQFFNVGTDQKFQFFNCDLILTGAYDPYLLIVSGGHMRWVGGSITHSTGAIQNILSNSMEGTGGIAEFFGTDLTACDGTIFASPGSSTGHSNSRCILDQCKLHASASIHTVNFTIGYRKVKATRSSSSSSAAEYQYYERCRESEIEDDTSFYRDGSVAFKDSAQKVSYKITTGSAVSVNEPTELELPASVWAALSSASTDTVRMHLLSSATLDDVDISIVAIYPDGTTKQLGNMEGSSGSAVSGCIFPDPLNAGTTLTTNTEAWTGRTSENRYQMDIDTSGDAGADSVPILQVWCTKPSTTIYICPTLEVVA